MQLKRGSSHGASRVVGRICSDPLCLVLTTRHGRRHRSGRCLPVPWPLPPQLKISDS